MKVLQQQDMAKSCDKLKNNQNICNRCIAVRGW